MIEICGGDVAEVVGAGDARSAELDAAGFGVFYSFGLTGADIVALVFGNERQQLKDYIAYDLAYKVFFVAASIEERHIENENIRADLFGDALPFLQNAVVVSAEPVD